MSDKPNPGSDDAIKIGCKCPVIDNAHGRGYMGGGSAIGYWMLGALAGWIAAGLAMLGPE